MRRLYILSTFMVVVMMFSVASSSNDSRALVTITSRTPQTGYVPPGADVTIHVNPESTSINWYNAPITNDMLIVVTLDGKICAIDANNGSVLWCNETSGPLVMSSLHSFIIPSIDGRLFANITGHGFTMLPYQAEELVAATPILAPGENVMYTGRKSYPIRINNDGVAMINRIDNVISMIETKTGEEIASFSIASFSMHRANVHSANAKTVKLLSCTMNGMLSGVTPGTSTSTGTAWKVYLSSPVVSVMAADGHFMTPVSHHYASMTLNDAKVAVLPVFSGIYEFGSVAIPGVVWNAEPMVHKAIDGTIRAYDDDEYEYDDDEYDDEYEYDDDDEYDDARPLWYKSQSCLHFVRVLYDASYSRDTHATSGAVIPSHGGVNGDVYSLRMDLFVFYSPLMYFDQSIMLENRLPAISDVYTARDPNRYIDVSRPEPVIDPETSLDLIPIATSSVVIIASVAALYLYRTRNGTVKTQPRLGKLVLSNVVLGHGSHGTTVFEGSYDGRAVAVKRMLTRFFEVAKSEVDMLMAADIHPSVLRYYCMERDDEFVYLGLERCMCSLGDYVCPGDKVNTSMSRNSDKSTVSTVTNVSARMAGVVIPPISSDVIESDKEGCRLAFELLSGLRFLSEKCSIVHGDLKPENVLLTDKLSIKISDMGLSKRLQDNHSTFTYDSLGSMGWRAPEILTQRGPRLSKGVDVFSAGCMLYYIFTRGGHPFGSNTLEREMAISNRQSPGLDNLEFLEGRDLVKRMLEFDPMLRWDVSQCLTHPTFWSPMKKLQFLLDVSDIIEFEDVDAPVVRKFDAEGRKSVLEYVYKNNKTPVTVIRSSGAPPGFAPAFYGWDVYLDQSLIRDLNRYRKYNYMSVRDLLRMVRNKRNHWRDLSPDLQAALGSIPEGYLRYFLSRFPTLFIYVYRFAADIWPDLRVEPSLRIYFE